MDSNSYKISVTRNKLYDWVWSKSITTLSNELDIPGPVIRDVCKEHEIPTPKQGHWMKLMHGKPSPRIPLPISDNVTIEIRTQSKTKIKNKVKEAGLAYKVSNRLTNPHPLVKKAKEIMNKQHAGSYGKGRDVVYSAGKCLATEVTRPNIPRALRLWDTLIKLIIKRGHEISDDKESEFLIFGEEFTIRVREILKRVKVEDSSWERYEKVGSGILSIKVHQFYNKKEWKNSKSKPIEDQLGDILLHLEELAQNEKRDRAERKEWHKKYEEEQAIKKLKVEHLKSELDSFKRVLESSARWEKSQSLRNYINAVEKQAIQFNLLDKEKSEWIKWAKEKADWFDPLIEREDDIFENVNRDTLETKSRWG